ncbi:hypothetical protein ACOZ4L_16865 (plasmid) [Haloplanus ruber]|nr:hypothetical protein [Haloplanus ruber]
MCTSGKKKPHHGVVQIVLQKLNSLSFVSARLADREIKYCNERLKLFVKPDATAITLKVDFFLTLLITLSLTIYYVST